MGRPSSESTKIAEIPNESGLPRYVTRRQVASILGRSYRYVATLQRKGLLVPYRRGPDRVWWFERTHVESLIPTVLALPRSARRRDGKLAAQVFAGLRDGKRCRDLVIELSVAPAVVRQLARQYAEPDDVLLPSCALVEVRAELDELGLAMTADVMLRMVRAGIRAERERVRDAIVAASVAAE